MRVPDFFIVGAPKCGTTALYTYLKDHPSVFMSPIKEPHFFATDFPNYRVVTKPEDYSSLFDAAPAGVILGEASVWYLYSEVAVANILSANRAAKFVVMLRNPVDLVQSLHSQLLFSFNEDIVDFWQAWKSQDLRANGQKIPPYCRERSHLLYREVGMLGNQVLRLLNTVSSEQVLLIMFDDFIDNTIDVYNHVLSFLELPSHLKRQFPKINDTKSHRNHTLGLLTRRYHRTIHQRYPGFYGTVKRAANRIGLRPLHLIKKHNRKSLIRPALSTERRAHLESVFRDDVARLEKILDRPLRTWRTNARGD